MVAQSVGGFLGHEKHVRVVVFAKIQIPVLAALNISLKVVVNVVARAGQISGPKGGTRQVLAAGGPFV